MRVFSNECARARVSEDFQQTGVPSTFDHVERHMAGGTEGGWGFELTSDMIAQGTHSCFHTHTHLVLNGSS